MLGSRVGIIASSQTKKNVYLDPLIWLNAGSLGLANGTELSTWASKSPATKTGTSHLYGTATIKPKYYNNETYPFVRMSDSSGNANGNYLEFGSMAINMASGITIAFCMRPKATTAYERYLTFVITDPSSSYGIWISRASSTSNFQITLLDVNGSGALGNFVMSNNNNVVNTWLYVVIRINSTSVKVNDIIGQTTYTPGVGAGNFTTDNTKIGAFGSLSSPSSFATFDIRDFLYYDRFLSDLEVTDIINNFKSQYNM